MLSCPDRVSLVLVEQDRSSGRIGLGLGGPKDPPAFVVQDPIVDQLIDETAGLERRVELERRVWPKQALVKLGLHMLGDPGIADREEALGIATVVANKMIA